MAGNNLYAVPISKVEFDIGLKDPLNRDTLREGLPFPWRAHNTMPDGQPEMYAEIPYSVEGIEEKGDLLVLRGVLHITEEMPPKEMGMSVKPDNTCLIRPGARLLEAYFASSQVDWDSVLELHTAIPESKRIHTMVSALFDEI